MKKVFTFILTLAAIGAGAQRLTSTTYMEKTVAGNKMGASFGYTFDYGVTVGGFHQQASKFLNANERQSAWNYERTFSGAYLAYPIKDYEKIDLDFNVRVGVSNARNFLITPSLWSYYQPVKLISIGLGLGVRAFSPTYQASISLKLQQS